MNNKNEKHILHVDGDSFFVSCEQAMNPSLRGKPVITGRERSIATAMSSEAKAAGIIRGMNIPQARKVCPSVIVVSGNYRMYTIFSKRMYEIVRRYTEHVEEYSIDECFADASGLINEKKYTRKELIASIQKDLEGELGVSFSIGISSSKVLAKLGSNHQKPHGLTVIDQNNIKKILEKTPIQKVWGIGNRTSEKLSQRGICSAQDFTDQNEQWIMRSFSKPVHEIYLELKGESRMKFSSHFSQQKSITSTRTFIPTRNKEYIFSRLSHNIEIVCKKARRLGLRSAHFSISLKTQEFTSESAQLQLDTSVNTPHILLEKAQNAFEKIYQKGVCYRATGAGLGGLKTKSLQRSLFEDENSTLRDNKDYQAMFIQIDSLSKKYGPNIMYLGSSYAAHKHFKDQENIKSPREIARPKLFSKTARTGVSKVLEIPWLGFVS